MAVFEALEKHNVGLVASLRKKGAFPVHTLKEDHSSSESSTKGSVVLHTGGLQNCRTAGGEGLRVMPVPGDCRASAQIRDGLLEWLAGRTVAETRIATPASSVIAAQQVLRDVRRSEAHVVEEAGFSYSELSSNRSVDCTEKLMTKSRAVRSSLVTV